MYYLGLDIGTSGCKAGVFTVEGECVAIAARAYSVTYPCKGWMELDVCEVWGACIYVMKECCRDIGGSIAAVSVASQGEAIFPIDKEGGPLAPAMVTFDTRAHEQADRLAWAFSDGQMYEKIMRPLHSMYSVAKVCWLRDHATKGWKYMCFSDYAVYMLSGEAYIDHSMASRTSFFDIRRKRWVSELIEFSGIQESELSKAVACATPVGYVKKDVAQTLGINPKAVVVTGAHDQACCALSVGVCSDGIVMDSLGTTESIVSVTDRATYNDTLRKSNIPCDRYVFDNTYAYVGFLATSGQIVRWYKEGLLGNHYAYDVLSQAPKGPTGIYVIPHFAGSGTPRLNDKDKGMIYGLCSASSRSSLYKAILEGTAYEARQNTELMEACGLAVKEIRIAGGGVRSDFWLRIKANIYGRSVCVSKCVESGTLGAAMIAAIGVGAAATDNVSWVRLSEPIVPEEEEMQQYEQHYQKYKALYAVLGEVNNAVYLPEV